MTKSQSTTTRRSRTAPNPLRDYTERWPKPTNSLWKRNDDAVDGPAWYARCNEHGTLQPAENVKEADVAGRKAQRIVWCASCHAAMPAPAPAKAKASKRTAKQAEADAVAAAIVDGSAEQIVELAKVRRTRSRKAAK